MNALFQTAAAHYAAGRFSAANIALSSILRAQPEHPALLHLNGLVQLKLGNHAEAIRSLRAARRGAPQNPEIANSLGKMLSDTTQYEAALEMFDAAIANSPGLGDARLNRGLVLCDLGRFDDARIELTALSTGGAFQIKALMALAALEISVGDLDAAAAYLEAVLMHEPTHALAQKGRAHLALQRGEPDAAARCRQVLNIAPNDQLMLLDLAHASAEQGEFEAVLDLLERRIEADPAWSDGRRQLASMLWECGRAQKSIALYERFLGAHPRDEQMWVDYVNLLSSADRHTDAATLCERALTNTGAQRFLLSSIAFWTAAGELDRARLAIDGCPDGTIPLLTLASYHLRRRDPEQAERWLSLLCEQEADNLEAWALRELTWRLLSDDRAAWLHGQPGLIPIIDLPIASQDVVSIAAHLRQLHQATVQRLGQSVRGGTQTFGNIFDRREPEMRLLRRTMRDAVEEARSRMPPADPTHPLLRHRDAPLAFAGSWSVRLAGGGYHTSHIHPKGLLSSVSYWSLPAPEGDEPGSGWLEIGRPPAFLDLDLKPTLVIEPKPGRLVLFPSTAYHGTRPFSAGERLTAAFDIVVRRGWPGAFR